MFPEALLCLLKQELISCEVIPGILLLRLVSTTLVSPCIILKNKTSFYCQLINYFLDCTGLWAGYYYCVGIPISFHARALYHADCTGALYNEVTIQRNTDGLCLDTNCQAASLNLAAVGDCPNGQVQISYWEQSGCTGQWFGYGYTSRNTCHRLWTEGWKFKSIHLRCSSDKNDCVTQKTCTYSPEPSHGICS